MLITGPAGTPVDQLFVDGDPSLNLTPSGTLSKGEMMFLAAFGMPPAAFRLQPAVVRLSCVGDCAAQLQLAADLNPGRVLWIDGTLTVGAASTLSLGSNALPAVVVVNGDMDLAAGSTVDIQGLVYSRGATWTAAGDASVTGAFIAEGAASVDPAIDGGFSIVGAPVIRFDATAVDQLNNVRTRQVLDFGSFVRVPGSWRDFPL